MAPLVAVAAAVLPALIEALAGPRAGQVADAVGKATQAVLGTDDPRDAALAVADPVKAAELRARLAEIALEEIRAEMADMASARAQTIALAQAGSGIAWAPAVISTVIVVGFFGCIGLLFFTERAWDERLTNLMFFVFGALVAAFERVGNYWLGSSSGSKRNGDIVRGALERVLPVSGSVRALPAPATADDLNARELTRPR